MALKNKTIWWWECDYCGKKSTVFSTHGSLLLLGEHLKRPSGWIFMDIKKTVSVLLAEYKEHISSYCSFMSPPHATEYDSPEFCSIECRDSYLLDHDIDNDRITKEGVF